MRQTLLAGRTYVPCAYCKTILHRDDRNLTIDHIMPRALGGEDTEENMVLCCKRCNKAKGRTEPTVK